MTFTRRKALGAVPLVALGACAPAPKVQRYTGPEITRITVFKESRRMYLWHEDRALFGYDIDLGFAPRGDKKFEGDGRTPEGNYLIDRRNPNSRYHLSLGISYPNAADIAEAKRLGKDPGGDIFIHGEPPRGVRALVPDWTWGCIAVTNEEIEQIYPMIQVGTSISIYA